MYRIAADTEGATFQELQGAQLLWVDRLGLYLFIQVLLPPPPQRSIRQIYALPRKASLFRRSGSGGRQEHQTL